MVDTCKLLQLLKTEREGLAEDGMVGWHHRLNGREFEQTWEVGRGRGAWRVEVHGVAESLT